MAAYSAGFVLRGISRVFAAALGPGWARVGRYRICPCRRLGTEAETQEEAERRAAQRRGHKDLLKEFPHPKNLLHNTLSRALGLSDLSQHIQYSCTEGHVKRATVTVKWPSRMQWEGSGLRKIDAERRAAAAACRTLKEMGVLGPGAELPQRLSALSGRPASLSEEDEEEEEEEQEGVLDATDFWQPQRDVPRPPPEPRPAPGDRRGAHALSLFPQPKALLAKVIQIATSSQSISELLQYRTDQRKPRTCQLSLCWPEPLSFTATGRHKSEAENRAAALACLTLKERGLIDGSNRPLTHAMYHLDSVRQLGALERRPCALTIPPRLQDRLLHYLTQYPVEQEEQQLASQREEEEEEEEEEQTEEEVVLDAVTGQSYAPLPPRKAQALSAALRALWAARTARGWEGALPVDPHRERLLQAVAGGRVTVVAGETGCGKTTRVPLFLLQHEALEGRAAHCNILVTQPRRISAVAVATRVSQQLGPSLSHCVGHQVRLDSRPPSRSGGALLFLTVGVLLRKLQGNGALQGVSHVVVDEVHERDVHTDLLLVLLRRALDQNPGLRVLLMSATGDPERLARYFGGRGAVVRVPGFMHPVRQSFLEDVLREMGRPAPPMPGPADGNGSSLEDDPTPDLDLVTDVIEHIDQRGEPGAVLCFLPGWQEIRGVQQRLEERAAFQQGRQLILPVHSNLPVMDQQAIFQHPPPGQRKIILATNIAETSLTVDDVVHVVDTGCHKEQRYNLRTKVSSLDTVWVSRSSVTQRQGRAGRCQPGHAYHLFPRQHLDAMQPFPVPEILRTPLENLVVQSKIHSPSSKAVEFLSQALDSPDRAAVREAVRTLQEIGVLDSAEALTALGQCVACVTSDPRLGKVLVLGALLRCALPLMASAACLTRDPFTGGLTNRPRVSQAKVALSGSSCSDHLAFSRVVQGWRDVLQKRSPAARQQYLEQHSLSQHSLRYIQGLMQQLSENLFDAQLVPRASDCVSPSSQCNQFSHEDQLVMAVLLAGLYPNLIQVRRGQVTRQGKFRPDRLSFRTDRGSVLLHRSTANRGVEQFPSRWLTFFTAVQSNGKVFIRDSSCVPPLALLLLADCSLTETVSGQCVEVALAGSSLVRCQLSVQSWELLKGLRRSLRAMLQRGLQGAPYALSPDTRDQHGQLIALLADLLNNTGVDWPRADGRTET
ncbi:ATP-dependent RNA helicase DHX30 [Amia ocellicauda]|uniref:ATP-dependent RNA helicase DHX30 n=1 Tax=Amia ocellicauda TaxID=2972642 RepID=UPI0034642870